MKIFTSRSGPAGGIRRIIVELSPDDVSRARLRSRDHVRLAKFEQSGRVSALLRGLALLASRIEASALRSIVG